MNIFSNNAFAFKNLVLRGMPKVPREIYMTPPAATRNTRGTQEEHVAHTLDTAVRTLIKNNYII